MTATPHFQALALDHAIESMWNDPFRAVGRRYWTQDDVQQRWYEVTPYEFEQAIIWYLLEHTQEAESDHPAYHYKVAVAKVRAAVVIRTRASQFTPPVTPRRP